MAEKKPFTARLSDDMRADLSEMAEALEARGISESNGKLAAAAVGYMLLSDIEKQIEIVSIGRNYDVERHRRQRQGEAEADESEAAKQSGLAKQTNKPRRNRAGSA